MVCIPPPPPPPPPPQGEGGGGGYYGATEHKPSSHLFNGLVSHYGDIQSLVPPPDYAGSMDTVCELPSGEKVVVELQVVKYNYWNKRSLTYAANVYAGQLKRGGKWQDVKRVVNVSILGANKTRLYSWHQPFKRHFIFRDGEVGQLLLLWQWHSRNLQWS